MKETFQGSPSDGNALQFSAARDCTFSAPLCGAEAFFGCISVIFLDAARAASLFVSILALLLLSVCLIVQVCLFAMISADVLVLALGAGLLVLKFCIRTKEPLPIQ